MRSSVPADHALMLLDFSDAFNSLDRTAMAGWGPPLFWMTQRRPPGLNKKCGPQPFMRLWQSGLTGKRAIEWSVYATLAPGCTAAPGSPASLPSTMAAPLSRQMNGKPFAADECQILLELPFPAGTACGGCGAQQDSTGDHAFSRASAAATISSAMPWLLSTTGWYTDPAGAPSARRLTPRSACVEPSEAAPRQVDVTVVHPLTHASCSAEVTPGIAAAKREADKLSSDAAREMLHSECSRLRLKFM